MNSNALSILHSPLFLLGLFLLLLNDFYLKPEFNNFLTGKLSDFTGLFVFPLFFAAFFPKWKKFIYIFTAVFFAFWKSPFSQDFVDLWNSTRILQIGRTVDYTDLTALTITPLSYQYFNFIMNKIFIVDSLKRVFAIIVVFISVFAFTATSSADQHYVRIDVNYKTKLKTSEIVSILKEKGIISDVEISDVDFWESNVVNNNHNLSQNYNSENKPKPPAEYKPRRYFAHFYLSYKMCASSAVRVFLPILEEKDFTIIEDATIYFTCAELSNRSPNPTGEDARRLLEEYRLEAQTLFEREVIEKLRQNSN